MTSLRVHHIFSTHNLLYNFRTYIIERLSGHVSGKPLIEPQIRPPLHGDQIAEPLVS